MKLKLGILLIITAISVQCTGKYDIIQENIEHAKAQLAYLIEASEADDTLRIPSTYKFGEIEFVPTDDWVSGFFAGTLWYMYELTGDEYYAEKAQKHTEILHDIQFLKWHHDVGFMVYDSYGNGLRLKNIEGYENLYEKKNNTNSMLSKNWSIFPLVQYYGIEDNDIFKDVIIRIDTQFDEQITVIIHIVGELSAEEVMETVTLKESKNIQLVQ